MGRRVRGGGDGGRTPGERVTGALARQGPASDGDEALSARRTGWLPSADPWVAEAGAPSGASRGDRNDRDDQDDRDDRDDRDDGEPEEAPRRLSTGRAVLDGVVPEPLRRGRWAVSWRAGTAAVVLAGVVAVLIAVRTAGAAEVQEVPPRSEPTATAPAAMTATEPLTVGAGEAFGAGAAGGPDGQAGGGVAAGAVGGAVQAAGVGAVVVVHVVGQVNAPGVVTVPVGSRVADALAGAGGATGTADLARVNLARLVVDGEQVHVPLPGEVALPVAAVPASSTGAGATGAAAAASGGPVNLNTADEAALDALPGIGEVLAGRILAWRVERGPFTSVDELGEIQGIGDALMGDLAPLVTV